MEESRKVAFFDFCETLANFQTADAYVDFVREHIGTKRMYRLERVLYFFYKFRFLQILDRLTCRRFSLNKKFKLFQLKGIGLSTLDEMAYLYYMQMIKPNLIGELIETLKRYHNSGYLIILVSGGYHIYLKYFAQEYPVDEIISTKIQFKNGVCTGKLDGLDCLGKNKILLLNIRFRENSAESVAFSDSITDLPFLKWVKKGFVVSKKEHQNWVDKYNLKEIIWN